MQKLIDKKNAILKNIAGRKPEMKKLENDIKPVKQMGSIHFSSQIRRDRDFEHIDNIHFTKRKINARLNELYEHQAADKKAVESVDTEIARRTKLDKLARKNPDKVTFSYRNKKEGTKK